MIEEEDLELDAKFSKFSSPIKSRVINLSAVYSGF